MSSFLIGQLNERLEKEIGGLPKTLFFECQHLRALAEYLLKNHFDSITTLLCITTASLENEDKDTSGCFSTVEKGHVDNQARAIQFSKTNVPVSLNEDYKSVSNSDCQQDCIAIIGMSGRYPMAKNVHEYWENLKAGRDCISTVPKDRWDHDLYYDPDYHPDSREVGKTYNKCGGFLDEIDKFDPLFLIFRRVKRITLILKSVFFSKNPGQLLKMLVTVVRLYVKYVIAV